MIDQNTHQNQENTETSDNTYTSEDIEKNKTMAGLSYLLFFLPLITCPQSKYARFHANQALLLLITGIGGMVILSIIPIIGWLLMPLFSIGVLVLGVMGLINGLNVKTGKTASHREFYHFEIISGSLIENKNHLCR